MVYLFCMFSLSKTIYLMNDLMEYSSLTEYILIV